MVLFPANTPESVKNAVGDLIRDITKDKFKDVIYIKNKQKL